MSARDAAQRRAVLLSARMRFSPEVQPVRETAIEQLVMQNMFLGDSGQGMTLSDLERNGHSSPRGIPTISSRDIEDAISRLLRTGRIVREKSGPNSCYRLAAESVNGLRALQRSADDRLARIVKKLFKHIPQGDDYAAPFLDCLCMIFSQLGESYVRLLKGEITADSIFAFPSVGRAIRDVRDKHTNIDESLFQSAVFTFFRDNDPDYGAVKWNLAQNYYVSKALGLDPGGHILSRELFGGAHFYLDTNVVIQALGPQFRHHTMFQTLARACKRLDIRLSVCQCSIDELQSFVDRQLWLLAKVGPHIPNELASRVREDSFRSYHQQLLEHGQVDLGELFSNFANPVETLANTCDAQVVEDDWFSRMRTDASVRQLAQEVKQAYVARSGRVKTENAAVHDALLLAWIKKSRESRSDRSWLITLDLSLPNMQLGTGKDQHERAAITLDALLQWISPIAVDESKEDEMAAIFGETVRYQLLPQETFFDMKDFLMFAELEWSTKELPAEDVEGCIRYIKANAPNLDPTSPTDREKIGREMAKYFADPGRKYKQEIQRLEADRAVAEEVYKAKLDEAREAIRERDERIEALENTAAEQRARKERRTPWSSGSFYLIAVVLLTMVAVIALNYAGVVMLPIILIFAILAISVVGALQLRHDERLSEKNFLTLMLEALKLLPLLNKSDTK